MCVHQSLLSDLPGAIEIFSDLSGCTGYIKGSFKGDMFLMTIHASL